MSSPIVSIPSWRATHSEASLKGREGADPTVAGRSSAPGPSTADALALLSHFELAERLVQVWIRNQRNLDRLKELGASIKRADRRLASSRPGRRIVEAHRERLLAERSAVLSQLRADERVASALVDETDARRQTLGERPQAFTA